MNIFKPLYEKRDEVAGELASIKKTLEDCAKLIAQWQPADCPHCIKAGEVKLIEVPATIEAPNAHGIAIHCFSCGLQTAPEYWHLTEYDTSVYAALYDVYQKWGFTVTNKEKADS